jgi:NAD(P)-dependent dehydrogenase (short-subunit alcohol dehydrogenase family)
MTTQSAVANQVDLFSGRVALVTGGTRGIGLGIARAFAAAGAIVVVCGRNEPLSLPEGLSFVAADVRDPEQARLAVDAAVDRHGRLDVLVNNAGGAPSADAATVSPRFVQKVVELNLLAPFYVAQAANARMQQQESGGAIVNIGSVAARQAEPRSAAYSAAKAGLLQLTRALALEWAPKVRVNHVTAGPVMTPAAAEYYGQDGGVSVAATIAMGRMAEPSDVAAACLFLASPLAGYVTGADLAVHGGGEVPARYLAANAELAGPGSALIARVREAVHLLRPADRDRDPPGPVPRLGVAGHVDDREAAEVLLGLGERPVGEDGRAAARVDAAHDGRRVQAAVAEDEGARVGHLLDHGPAGRAPLAYVLLRQLGHPLVVEGDQVQRHLMLLCSRGGPDDCPSPSLRTHRVDSTPRPALFPSFPHRRRPDRMRPRPNHRHPVTAPVGWSGSERVSRPPGDRERRAG